jgi:hypothetical protein
VHLAAGEYLLELEAGAFVDVDHVDLSLVTSP